MCDSVQTLLSAPRIFCVIAIYVVGCAVAECWQEDLQKLVELISSYVLPAYRHQPIEKQLHQHLRQAINHLSLNADN